MIPKPLVLALLLSLPAPRTEAAQTVHVENASVPTRCAEEDNVYVKFRGDDVRRLTIEAVHPPYMTTLRTDHMAADFTNCVAQNDPSYDFAPKDVTLYEDSRYLLLGHTFGKFWRPGHVDFRVGAAVTPDLHLVQLVRKIGRRRIEILVVYPPDGYWRAKPLPPAQFADTGYGSSFLVGPIEEGVRPFVALSSIEFIPGSLTFVLRFKDGEGSLRVVKASSDETRLAVTLPPSPRGAIFAALRSMFVAGDNADTAEAVLVSPSGDRRTTRIMDFKSGDAREALFSRSVESRHNASAPDLRFGDFGP